ncbi:leukotriene B4 receptor 1-like [Sebastes fasciatus]|uniref:leukotriene B4 receptor 1-like n=1 Tax=Sebastes fasciatus TaxID=394691 RepID=UPI003D9EBC47
MNHSAEQSPSEETAPEEFDGGTTAACVILGLSFLVGAPGNLLVIWTILRHVKQRSHTVVLILHLAAADLLVLITLPLWIYSLVHTWMFGEAFCKALVYIVSVCMFSSIFFITLMSMERYLAICHPFVMMRWKTKSVMNRCLIVLWLLALLLGVPAVLTQPLDGSDGAEQCFMKEFSSVTQAVILLCLETFGGFVAPFIILSICYCLVAAQLRKMSFNSKQKSMFLVHAVVIAFTLCWLPYHVINIIDLVCILGSGTEHECVPESVVFSSGALVFISSSVNPVLYALFARNFRGSLEKSRLVRLFQEMATHTNKLRELVVQQPTSQGAANTQVELMPSD